MYVYIMALITVLLTIIVFNHSMVYASRPGRRRSSRDDVLYCKELQEDMEELKYKQDRIIQLLETLVPGELSTASSFTGSPVSTKRSKTKNNKINTEMVPITFTPIQDIITSNVAISAFKIDQHSFLAFPFQSRACHIYRYENGGNREHAEKFNFFQSVEKGEELIQCLYCNLDSEHYMLAIKYDSSFDTVVHITKWNGDEFVDYMEQSFRGALGGNAMCFSVKNGNYGNNFSFLTMDFYPATNTEIFEWNGLDFSTFQYLQRVEGAMMTSFERDGQLYISVDDTARYRTIIYKFEKTGKRPKFVRKQSIDVYSYPSLVFNYNDNTFLFSLRRFLDVGLLDTEYYLERPLYIWRDNEFELLQYLDTIGPVKACPFIVDDQLYLLVANHYNGTSYDVDSTVYWYNGTEFVRHSTLDSYGAESCYSFDVDDQVYLLMTNKLNQIENTMPGVLYKVE